MKKLGLVAADTPVFEGHRRGRSGTASVMPKASEARRMAVYAAMVDDINQNIGRMLDYLKKTGQLDNTFVFFLSEQRRRRQLGVRRRAAPRVDPQGHGQQQRAHRRVGFFAEYGPGCGAGGLDTIPHVQVAVYEGGIAVPAIAWGPGVKRGEVKGAMAHVTDIAPTLFDLARTRHPGTEYQGKPVLPLRGKSMVPYLQGQAKAVRGDSDTVGWELGGRKALRKGDWKIVFANAPWGTRQRLGAVHTPGRRTAPRAATSPQPTRRSSAEMLVAWRDYVRETGTLEIPGLADRPGYSNGAKYYEDLKYEATLEPRVAR